ncbi:hypothetical protein ACLMJK_005073 [Lecanora helva]
MSPHLVSKNPAVTVKSETSYHSPPSSLSDGSQGDPEDSRGRGQERDRSTTAKGDEESGDEKENGGDNSGGKPRKRKRSRKGLEKNFPCPHQGCGKSYSRAEHLYRHQLNHSPKKIYNCNFPGCERQFVRQDLCTRHRERHTARGSHLQRKDNNALDMDDRPSPADGQIDPGFRTIAGPNNPTANHSAIAPAPFMKGQDMHGISGQSPLTGAASDPYQPGPHSATPPGSSLKSPQTSNAMAGSEYGPNASSLQRSNSNEQFYGDHPQMTRNLSNSTYPSSQRHPSFGSYKSAMPPKNMFSDSRLSRSNSTNITTNPANYRPSPTSTYNGHSQNGIPQSQMQNNVSSNSYIPHQNFPSLPPLPPPVVSPMSQMSTPGTQLGTYSNTSTPLTPVDATSNFDMYGSNGLDPNFIDHNGNPYGVPLFGGDGYSRSPFAMADDFTAWLFNEPNLNPSSPGGHRHGSMSVGSTAFMDESGGMGRGIYGITNDTLIGPASGGQPIPQQNLMALNSILDPALPRINLSEEKRKDILDLIETRFTDHAPFTKQKDDFLLDGDRDLDSHVLSLRSMQTYIGSYWYHFHPQMPILHKPTFSADKSQSLLLIAVIAIGASCLDKVHGPNVTQAGAELSNFLAWHLRGEIFKHVDFLPPAKLWVFQTLLLLEIYEKMYSTRVLHERAHIHHGTTLTLMRRGSSLIGRSALDSPPTAKDDTSGMTPNSKQASTAQDPEQWWHHWITNEATRRVAFAAFIIDSIHATMFGHSATMVAHEMKLQLPCDESLWSATSAAEVGRIENNLNNTGIRPMTFFDGLKNTLKGKQVRTNSFGRTAIMAGLLSVSWHMNQRDVQVHHLGALKALGGKDIWRGPLTKAFDSWKNDFDRGFAPDSIPPAMPYGAGKLDEENIFESRTVLHHLAHMAMHVDVVSCQIFAKAKRLLGRTTLPSDYAIAQKRIRDNWAPRPSARHATFYALKFLSQVLMPDAAAPHRQGAANGMEGLPPYSARDDFLLNRPWVLYFASLIVWSYGYALDGSLESIPNLYTVDEKIQDMRAFLTRVGGIQDPRELEHMRDRNSCLGMLYVLQAMFEKCRWELLHEAARLLGNCIKMLRGVPVDDNDHR